MSKTEPVENVVDLVYLEQSHTYSLLAHRVADAQGISINDAYNQLLVSNKEFMEQTRGKTK